MSDLHDDAGPPDTAGPKERAPLGGPRAWRLTFRYDEQGVHLVDQQHVAMLAPPDDSPKTLDARAGYWVEVRDAQGHGLYRQLLHDPMPATREAHFPDPQTQSRHVPAESAEGVFQVVVPDLPQGHDVVVHGRRDRAELALLGAAPMVTAVLRPDGQADGVEEG